MQLDRYLGTMRLTVGQPTTRKTKLDWPDRLHIIIEAAAKS